MYRKHLYASLISAVACFSVGSYAQADSKGGFDFSTFGAVEINKDDNEPKPVLLRKVTVKCPAKGFLIARAHAEFSYGFDHELSGGFTPPFIGVVVHYGLARGGEKNDEALFGINGGTAYLQPGETISEPRVTTIGLKERVDTCKAGQSFRYRFVAAFDHDQPPTGDPNLFGPNLFAVNPVLIVEFLRNRI